MASATSEVLRVFIPVPMGLPDPNVARPDSGPDTRPRVIYRGAHGTCVDGVFRLIRDHFEAPNIPASHPGRAFEILTTKRKAEQETHTILKQLLHDDRSPGKMLADIKKPKKATDIPSMRAQVEAFGKKVPANWYSYFMPSFLREFTAPSQTTCDNLFQFLQVKQLQIGCDIDERFLAALKLDPKVLFEKFKKDDPFICEHRGFIKKSYEQLKGEDKYFLLEMFCKSISAERFGFKTSRWRPTHTFPEFLAILSEERCMAVGGHMGRACFKVPPSDTGRKIEGRKILCWKKGDPTTDPDTSSIGHQILLVGGERLKQGDFVWFLDPNDDRDPAKPDTECVLTMSYKRLVSGVMDEHDCQRVVVERATECVVADLTPPSVGFAWCKKEKEEEKKKDG